MYFVLVSVQEDEQNGVLRVGGIVGEIWVQNRGGLPGETGSSVQGDRAQRGWRPQIAGER